MLNKRRKTDVCGRNIDVIDLSSIFKTEFEIILFTSMKKNKSDRSSPRLYTLQYREQKCHSMSKLPRTLSKA